MRPALDSDLGVSYTSRIRSAFLIFIISKEGPKVNDLPEFVCFVVFLSKVYKKKL